MSSRYFRIDEWKSKSELINTFHKHTRHKASLDSQYLLSLRIPLRCT